MTRVWTHSKQKGSNLLLTLALADHANDDGICWPGLSSLHKKVRMSERQTQRILDKLIETGEVYIKPGNGRGHKSFYAVLSGLDTKAISKVLQDNFEMSRMEANDTAETLYAKRCQDVTLKRKGVKKSPITKKGDKLSERVTFSTKKGDILQAENSPEDVDADDTNGQTSKTTTVIEPSLETYLSQPPSGGATDALGSEIDETPIKSQALEDYLVKQATTTLSAEVPAKAVEPPTVKESVEKGKLYLSVGGNRYQGPYAPYSAKRPAGTFVAAEMLPADAVIVPPPGAVLAKSAEQQKKAKAPKERKPPDPVFLWVCKYMGVDVESTWTSTGHEAHSMKGYIVHEEKARLKQSTPLTDDQLAACAERLPGFLVWFPIQCKDCSLPMHRRFQTWVGKWYLAGRPNGKPKAPAAKAKHPTTCKCGGNGFIRVHDPELDDYVTTPCDGVVTNG